MQQRKTPPCDACGVEGAVKGAVMGLCWGAFTGLYFGWGDGIRGRPLMAHVASNLALNTLGFSLFCGSYQMLHCSAETWRGRSDWKNAAIAGFLTGGVMGSFTAVRSGQPKLALLAAIGTSAITTAVDQMRSKPR